MDIVRSCPCCGSTRLIGSPAVLMPFVAHRALNWAPIEINETWKLDTIPTSLAFTICNSLHCETCHFLFLDIRFDNFEIGILYCGYRQMRMLNSATIANLNTPKETRFLKRELIGSRLWNS
jgi:hypothetical protein